MLVTGILRFWTSGNVVIQRESTNVLEVIIVSLEKGVVLYGANALSLLPVVLFVSIG